MENKSPLAPTADPDEAFIPVKRHELRRLIDRVTNHIYENETVLATQTIDRLIDEWWEGEPPGPGAAHHA